MTTAAYLKGRTVLRLADNAILGRLTYHRDGWRFLPAFQRAPSRRGWPTPDAALKTYRIRLNGEARIPCPRCGEVLADRAEADGCRDFHCPMQEPE